MQIKLFGHSLFAFRTAKQDSMYGLLTNPESEERKSKYLPDFYKSGNGNFVDVIDYVSFEAVKKVETKPEDTRPEVTPKGLFLLKTLNNDEFRLNVEPEYVEQQILDFKDKLGMIKTEEYDMRRGVEELTSIVMRLENRRKYSDVDEFFSQYPYTTTSKVEAVINAHKNLQLGQIAQFIADMPKEAVEAMKAYNKNTDKVCGKQAVFYIIADKKDFKKVSSRKDPILLAQSPFGHFWQIIGAWDEEMMFLEEL